jgi:hypothetical protein
MSDPPSKDELTARLEAVEARTDAKTAQVLGEIRTGFVSLEGKLATLDVKVGGIERAASGTKTTIVATAIATVAAIVAILAYGQTWFGIGVTTRDTVKATVAEYLQEHSPPAPSAPPPTK